MKCLYRLYDKCAFYEEIKQQPTHKECSLCIKAYRLRYGLVTILKTKGLRTGVTL
jgi:hypothetical protein